MVTQEITREYVSRVSSGCGTAVTSLTCNLGSSIKLYQQRLLTPWVNVGCDLGAGTTLARYTTGTEARSIRGSLMKKECVTEWQAALADSRHLASAVKTRGKASTTIITVYAASHHGHVFRTQSHNIFIRQLASPAFRQRPTPENSRFLHDSFMPQLG